MYLPKDPIQSNHCSPPYVQCFNSVQQGTQREIPLSLIKHDRASSSSSTTVIRGKPCSCNAKYMNLLKITTASPQPNWNAARSTCRASASMPRTQAPTSTAYAAPTVRDSPALKAAEQPSGGSSCTRRERRHLRARGELQRENPVAHAGRPRRSRTRWRRCG